MFDKIARNHNIFLSDLFLKDAMAFCVIDSIRNDAERYPTPKVFSDKKDCIMINSDPNHPVITWTSDNFKAYGQLYDFIKQEFGANAPLKIMAKKCFYDDLVKNRKMPALNVQTLGVYSCLKLNDVAYIGRPDQAKTDEILQVAQMLVNFDKETKENPDAQVAEYMDLASEFVSAPTHCVWRDRNDKLVALATLRINERYPRIGRVYTLVDERGKSYAKMLVHYLTTQILKAGKKAMLFTDFDYAPSNRCYQAIGYKLNGTIVNFIPPIEE